MAAFLRKLLSNLSKEMAVSFLQKVMAELTATFIMMFIGFSAVFISKRDDINFVAVAFTWTAMIVAMGYTFGHISGCHMNPAVTIAFAADKLFPWKQVPFYALAQLTGSTLASLAVSWLFNGDQTSSKVMLTLPSEPNPVSNLQAVAWEIIISSILMLVIRGSGTDPRAAKHIGGLAVPAVVFCNIIVAGKITGASMNPARSLGPAIITGNFEKIWIYIISPVIGTVAGSMLYNFFTEEDKNDHKKSVELALNPMSKDVIDFEMESSNSIQLGDFLEIV